MQSDDSAAARLRHLLTLAQLVPMLPFRIVVRSLPLLTKYLCLEPWRLLEGSSRTRTAEFLLSLAGASLLAAFGNRVSHNFREFHGDMSLSVRDQTLEMFTGEESLELARALLR